MSGRTIYLNGGYSHGKSLRVLHGSSVFMASTNETYSRPDNPKMIGGAEVWPLVEFEGEVVDGRPISPEISDMVAERMKLYPPKEG